MFGSKKSNTVQEQAPRTVSNSRNLVGKGTEIEGEVLCEGDIRIDGSLEGLLKSKSKVVIGPTGYVKGDIVCENGDISGKIIGTIKVSDQLYLKSTANVQGNVVTTKLVVDAGAVINGQCSMPVDGKMIDSASSSGRQSNSSQKDGGQKEYKRKQQGG